ncbi:endonuclease [Xanthomonas phage BUDD]|nr:endonuclease [Xanthomonas phage BUDD]
MIYFRKLRFKNILSFGNMMTEVQLDRSPSTMVIGKNGVGKSSLLLDTLAFGLFGKPFRKIKKEHLINTKNGKDALVEIEFDKDGKSYLVRRGIKPGIFEIFEDGKLLNQEANNRDYQKIFEQQILCMNYDAACQIILVGKAQHTMFMQLNTGERRKFVEVVLNLIVFSNMARLHNAKTTELRNRIGELKTAITVSGEKIKLRKKYIDDLKNADKQNAAAELERITAQIEEINSQLTELHARKSEIESVEGIDRAAYKKAMTQLSDHSKMIVKLDTSLSQIESSLRQLNKSQDCPTCHRPLEHEDHAKQVDHLTDKKAKIDVAKIELSLRIREFEDVVAEFEVAVAKYDAYIEKVRGVDMQIASAESKRDFLVAETKKERHSQADKILEAKTDLKKLEDMNTALVEKLESLYTKSDYMSLIGTMLQDKGIKTMLIKRFIPIINHEVNTHLNHLGLFVNFHLDENFDETIKARGFDTLGYNSFSEGEKLRMDMALLMAWRDIARMQGNVATNILIFDEIFDSSLDQGGADALADMLALVKDLNVFIVTHTPEKIIDKVRSTMKIEKIDGFSRIV